MKFVSWNVNGLRACIQKGFLEAFQRLNADFFCLQETKLQAGQIDLDLPGYFQYWNYAEKKGYSGTAVFTKHEPRSVSLGLGVPELDTEGRLITLEYDEFYLVTCYTPNAQRGLARLDHRLWWEVEFRKYVTRLDAKKPVILCGDLNVAHKEIDLKNPSSNRGSAGFSDQEREAFGKLLDCGFTDTFRHLHPDATGKYTWWSYMYKARENNAGWRIDYFLTSQRIRDRIYKTPIYSDIMGSDHCPVALELDTTCNGGIWSDEITEKPTSAEPEKPVLPPMSPAVKAGVAAGIFAVGFATGTLMNQVKPAAAVIPGTTDIGFYVPPVANTTGGNYGIATDYAAKTTQELVSIAISIGELSQYRSLLEPITRELYEQIKARNPVLWELEQRTDAISLLAKATVTESNTQRVWAAHALRLYYTHHHVDQLDDAGYEAAPGEMLLGLQEQFLVYEQTQKMEVVFAAPSMILSTLYPGFLVGDRTFLLEDAEVRVNMDNVNFCVRIVPTESNGGTLNPLFSVNGLTLEQFRRKEDWLRYSACRDSKEGGFLYGHVSQPVQITAQVQQGDTMVFCAGPIMNGPPSTKNLARYICEGMDRWMKQEEALTLLSEGVELLTCADAVEVLYQLATTTSYPYRQHAFRLLQTEALQQKMTENEKMQMEMLAEANIFYAAYMNSPATVVPVGTANTENPHAFYVKQSQAQLDAMELNMMDFWVDVSLRPGGMYRYDPEWNLEVVMTSMSTEEQDISYYVWEQYDETGENFLGWIIGGRLNGPPMMGTFRITSNGELLDEKNTLIYPVNYDYSQDSDIFVDSSSSSIIQPRS